LTFDEGLEVVEVDVLDHFEKMSCRSNSRYCCRSNEGFGEVEASRKMEALEQ
jgi:hypothetical protein